MEEKGSWGSWLGCGMWAIIDQGLFALVSVLLNLLLASWLAPAEYGAFAVAYSVFLLLGAVHTAAPDGADARLRAGKVRRSPAQAVSGNSSAGTGYWRAY